MERQSHATTSLGAAKLKSFGLTLKDAIAEEFGSSKAFALALGVSPGRVSQLIGGPESVDPSTMQNIVRCFSAQHLAERLHRAWINEFAPLPKGGFGLYSTSEFLSRLDSGSIELPARQYLKALERHRREEPDFALWFSLSERMVHLFSHRAQTANALLVLNEMEERAKTVLDPLRIAWTLWMRLNVLRNFGAAWPVLQDAENLARTYLEAVFPPNPSGAWLELRACLNRDSVLNMLSGVESGSLPHSALDSGRTTLRTSANSLVLYYYAKEVEARIAVAQNDIYLAEDLIDELETDGLPYYPALGMRLQFLRAGVHEKRGKRDEAIYTLENLLSFCQATGNLHHARKADRLLTGVLIQDAAPKNSPLGS